MQHDKPGALESIIVLALGALLAVIAWKSGLIDRWYELILNR